MKTMALRATEANPPVAIAEKKVTTNTNAHMLRVIGRTSFQSGESLLVRTASLSEEGTIVLPIPMAITLTH